MTRSRVGWLAGVVAAGAICTGCSGGLGGEPPPLDIAALTAATSEYQRGIIGDGTVTAAEYEESLIAYRVCVEDAGAEPSEIYDNGNNEKAFDYQINAPDDDALAEIDAKAEACLPEYFEDVARVWAYQELLSPTEIDDVRPAVVACLRGLGLDVPDDLTIDTLRPIIGELDDASVIQPCVQEFPGFFSVAPDPARSDTHR